VLDATDRGPAELDQTGGSANIWGVWTIQSTQMPAGQALVMSVQLGAALDWIRMGMTVQWNPYGDDESATMSRKRTIRLGERN
jgi:hypothetical protein